MKRILSLVLVLVLALGSVPVAFAATETEGDMLKAAGFVAGDQDGNLNEDQKLTREQMMVLIAEMNGVKEEAATFGIPFDFSDVNENDWFAPYVWYAAYQGWTAGMGDGSFGAGVAVDSKMAATFMLKALDYDVADYNASVEQAADMGIEITATSEMTRGEGFKAMWSTVNLPKQGSDVALGVELGKIETTEEAGGELEAAVLDTVEAISANRVYVEFDAEVAAAAAGDEANYVIVEKKDDATKTVEVLEAQVDSDVIVVLKTASMKTGTAYTLTVDESSVNFTGISKESDTPELKSVKAVDGDQIEVKFDMKVTAVTAEDVANYSIDKEGTVVKAELDKEDRDVVTLTVEGFATTSSKKLTVENVTSIDDVKMSKEYRTFTPKFDKKSPKIDAVKASPYNNVEVIINFDDDHGVDKETAEDVSNYAIDGLEIYSAKAIDVDEKDNSSDDDDYYNRVVLTTSEQSKSKSYTLKVLNMVDGSTAKKNATTKTLEEKFRGGNDDDDKPTMASKFAKFVNMEEVHVTFSEKNALDAASALDLGNYKFEDNELDITDIYFDDEDDNGNEYDSTDAIKDSMDGDEIIVVLKVAGVEEDQKYKLIVDDIADIYGNTTDEKKVTIEVKEEVQGFAAVESIEVVDKDTINVFFQSSVGSKEYGDLDEPSAEDPTNYVFSDLGAANSATLKSSGDDKVKVVLDIPEMTVGKTYTLTVNNVKNLWGYAAEDVEKKFVANPTSVEDEQPEITDVDYDNYGELVITFDQAMRTDGLSARTLTVVEQGTTAVAATLKAVDAREDGTVLVFNAQASATKTTDVLLDLNQEYEINEFQSVVSAAGMPIEHKLLDGQSFTTESDEFAPADDAIKVDNIYQENGDTIFVYFDGDVKLAATTMSAVIAGTAQTMEFELDDDDDEKNFVEATLVSGTFPKDSKDLEFNFVGEVTDVLGRDVYMDDTANIKSTPSDLKIVSVEVEYDEEDAPNVDSVTAVDNETIEIKFDEKKLSYTGAWKLVDSDDDDKNQVISTTKFASSNTKVKLTLSSAMKVGTNYELTMTSTPRDLGNESYDDKDDSWSIIGPDNAPEADFVGLELLNATTAKITGDNVDSDLTDLTTVVLTGSNITNTAQYTVGSYDADADAVIITLDETAGIFFKEGVNYSVTVGSDTSAKVDGILKLDTAVTVTTPVNTTNIVITLSDYSEDTNATTVTPVLYTVSGTTYTPHAATKVSVSGSVITMTGTFTTTDSYVLIVKEDGVVRAITSGFESNKK